MLKPGFLGLKLAKLVRFNENLVNNKDGGLSNQWQALLSSLWLFFIVYIVTQKTPRVDFSGNPYFEPSFEFYDKRLLDLVSQPEYKIHQFFRLLALCHTVMPAEKNGMLAFKCSVTFLYYYASLSVEIFQCSTPETEWNWNMMYVKIAMSEKFYVKFVCLSLVQVQQCTVSFHVYYSKHHQIYSFFLGNNNMILILAPIQLDF